MANPAPAQDSPSISVTKSIPAFIFYSTSARPKTIAARSTLDRLIIACHRAGAAPITIVALDGSPKPAELKSATAWNIPLGQTKEVNFSGPVLLASAQVLADAADVRRCIENGGRLVGQDGEELPLGVGAFSGSLDASLAGVPTVKARRPAVFVHDEKTARAAEKLLWSSLKSSADGVVDRYLNRPLGRLMSLVLIHTPVSPNAISAASILIGVLSAFLFATGDTRSVILGALLFQLSAVIDCVDGDIARVLFKESVLGKWLDLAGDQVVHVAVFAGIAYGVFRAGAEPAALWLGISAVAGALASFAVVLRGMRLGTVEGSLLQKLIDSATNRDFSLLVLALAIAQKIHFFLWLAAIGSHLFWMLALAVQLLQPRRNAG